MVKREEPQQSRQPRPKQRLYSAGATASQEAEVPEPAGDGPRAGPTASVEEAGRTAQGERTKVRLREP